MPRIITVTSGKGGVGKTNISVNLALELACRGYRTCLFDADLGLANVNILLGLYPEVNLSDAIMGQKTIPEILIRNYQGIDIVPGGTGIPQLATLDPSQIHRIISGFSNLDAYDFILFDTSAGAGADVTAFCRAASEILLIITPEPTSLTDSYSLLKILSAQGCNKPVQVVVNQARHLQHARIPYLSLSRTVAKHLPIKISAIGFIAQDSHVTEAVKLQKPFLSLYPKAIASACIKKIADRLISGKPAASQKRDMKSFWTEYVALCHNPGEIRPLSSAAPQPPAAADSTTSADRFMEKIAQSLSIISTELTTIRKFLTQREPHPIPKANETKPLAAKFPVRPIPLDFEAFLEQKKKEHNKKIS
jgi:flagellar biosynthesis protein FlhG